MKQKNIKPLTGWSEWVVHLPDICPDLVWTPPPATLHFRAKVIRVIAQDQTTNLALVGLHYRDLPELAHDGCLLALDDVFSQDELKRFEPKSLALCSHDGNLFGIPEDIYSFSLVFLKDRMKKYGFEAPSGWEEWESQLRQIRKKTGEVPAIINDNLGNRIFFIHSLTGSHGVDFSRPQTSLGQQATSGAIRAFDWFKTLIDDGLIELQDERLEKPEALLRDGRRTFFLAYPPVLKKWSSTLHKQLQLSPFPRSPSAQKTCSPLGGTLWCSPHNTLDPQRAKDALRRLQEPKLVKRLTYSGCYPFPAQHGLWTDRQLLKKVPYFRYVETNLRTAEVSHAPQPLEAWNRELDKTFWEAIRRGFSGRQWFQWFAQQIHVFDRPSITHPLVRKILDYIDLHQDTIKSGTEVARIMRKSHNQMLRIFRKEVGEGFGDYLNRRRLVRARELLSDVTLSIKEIAYRTGFQSPEYFSHAFKKQWGITASDFRKSDISDSQS